MPTQPRGWCPLASPVLHAPTPPPLPALQGFGNVGSWAARLLHEQGGLVVAVSDAFGAIACPAGLDIPALVAHLAAHGAGGLAAFPGGAAVPKESLLTTPCDVLIPAAIGGVITEEVAPLLRCKVRRGAGAGGGQAGRWARGAGGLLAEVVLCYTAPCYSVWPPRPGPVLP